MSVTEARRKIERTSNISTLAIAKLCRNVVAHITDETFINDQLSPPLSVFSDLVKARSIDGWFYKLAYDSFSEQNRSAPHQAYAIGEATDLFIREFGSKDATVRFVEKLLHRRLLKEDEIRLLWIGDHGPEFAKQFLLRFADYLEQHFGNSSLIIGAMEID